MVDYDPAIIGRVFETTEPLQVSAEMVANFCTAIGESNPIHTDADAASYRAKAAGGGRVEFSSEPVPDPASPPQLKG